MTPPRGGSVPWFRNQWDGTEPAWAPYLPAAELLIDCEDRTLRAVLHRDVEESRQVGGQARTSDVGFRVLLELGDLDRQSKRTGDIACS